MLNTIKVTCLFIMFVSTGCAMAEDYKRTSEPLPKASPRIIVVESSPTTKSAISNYSGLFATLMVRPKVRNGEYWKPKGLREAAMELNRMLPPKFIKRFSKYYGLGNSLEALNGYTPDSDIEERQYDLDQYLINIWGLDTNSKLGVEFQCMGIFERDLHKFYVFWAGLEAETNGMSIETDISTEYHKLKSYLKKECGF